jgi:DNA repair exonuclease SbcCD ATPase subunit
VLHGPNGSGKSSLAEAVDTALRGEPRPPHVTGRGGNLPLWERDHVNRDAEAAEVEVVLTDGEDRLTVGCQLDQSGVVDRWARLRSRGQERDVHLAAAATARCT